MSTTEDLLRRTLHTQADRTTYEPARVEDLATRARFLQRSRRRTAGLAAAAAVAAIAVPVAFALGSDSGRRLEPAPAPPSVVTTTVGPFEDLPEGAAPRVDYVDDDTYVAADGTRTELPAGDQPGVPPAAAAPYRGGFLVATGNLAIGSNVTWVDADGETRWTRCGSDRIAVSEDGRVIGYSAPGGGADCAAWASPLLTWGPTDGPGDLAEQAAPSGERADPIAVTDEEMLYNAIDAETGDSAGAYLAPVTGSPQQVPGLEVATAFDPESRTVAGRDGDEVGVLVDVDTGEVRLRFEDGRTPIAFSPDGRYVVSALFTADGRSPIVVHDATTGDALLVVAAPEPNGTLADATAVAWEGDTHLLVGALTTRQQAIVRIGLDGAVELATQPGRETLAGFMFPARSSSVG